MDNTNFRDNLKRDTVRQTTERGLSCPGDLSAHLIYQWTKQYSSPPKNSAMEQTDEIRPLKRGLALVTEERDIYSRRIIG